MRILIYSESDTAKALQADLRAERHHASLRNPQFFDKPDSTCETAYADEEAILNAYADAGIPAHRITYPAVEAATDAPAEPAEATVEPTPKRKRK
jgi:hypothetical protein